MYIIHQQLMVIKISGRSFAITSLILSYLIVNQFDSCLINKKMLENRNCRTEIEWWRRHVEGTWKHVGMLASLHRIACYDLVMTPKLWWLFLFSYLFRFFWSVLKPKFGVWSVWWRHSSSLVPHFRFLIGPTWLVHLFIGCI